MVQFNYRRLIWCVVIIVIVVFLLLYPRDISAITFSEIWKTLGKTVAIVSTLFLIFTKYLWRYRIFKFLIPIPYLGGKWSGKLTYEWNDKECSKPIELSIQQTLFYIQLTIKTNESISHSCSASFNIDELKGNNEIIYSYFNQPSIQNRDQSPIHYGAARLTISKNNTKLEGYYWTDRKTVGGIVFTKK